MRNRIPLWRQWRNARKNETVLHLAALAETMQHVLSNLVGMWDVKPALYAIKGDKMDPIAELIGTMPSLNPACFINAYDDGWRVPEGTDGLLYVFEAYRHFEFQEILETPEAEEILRKQFKREHPDQVDSLIAYENFYSNEIMPKLPPPSLLPEPMRKGMRVAVLVTKEGYGILAHQTRDKDDLNGASFGEDRIASNLGQSGPLYQLLHGLRPEEDAVGNVKNFRILQEIEALG